MYDVIVIRSRTGRLSSCHLYQQGQVEYHCCCRSHVCEEKSAIITAEASAKSLGLESEKRLRGRGVSVCATCDAAFFKEI